MPAAQPVPAEVKAMPEGDEVMVTPPDGAAGAKASPLNLESAGAASSCVNDVPGFVAAARTSVIPKR